MRTLLRPLAAVLVALVLTACGDAGGAVGSRAATVNGTDISRDLLERIVTAQTTGDNAPPEDQAAEATQQVQTDVLSTLISIEIVRGLAQEQGVEVSDADLDEAYQEQVELYEQQAGPDAAFADFLETIGLTEDEYRDLIVADLARREALAASYGGEVTDQQVQDAYDERRETEFLTRSTRHILVETEEEAADVLARLEDGEDFAAVAEEVSTDPGSAAQGGELGAQPRGSFVEAFDEAVWSAGIGDVVGPVETEFGFHVIEVLEETEVPFEEAEAQLRSELEQASMSDPELTAAVQEAFTEADVSIVAGLGEWDAEQGRVVTPDLVGEPEQAPATDGGAPAPTDGGAPQDAPADDAATEPEGR